MDNNAPEGICSACGTVDDVILDHAGWGWICKECFVALPPSKIRAKQLEREAQRQANIAEAYKSGE